VQTLVLQLAVLTQQLVLTGVSCQATTVRMANDTTYLASQERRLSCLWLYA
jgi:hypothetical protein